MAATDPDDARVSTGAATRGWLLAGSVYFLAVFHRSSLGVAGLLAERRFGIGASELSVFVLLQMARVWVLAVLGTRWTTRIVVALASSEVMLSTGSEGYPYLVL